MDTTNIDILRSFYSVTNRNQLNREVYNFLLKRWDLDGVNLQEEQMRIDNKMSKLSKSRREAIKEFLILENIVNDMEARAKTAEISEQSMNANDEIVINNNQSLIVGNTI